MRLLLGLVLWRKNIETVEKLGRSKSVLSYWRCAFAGSTNHPILTILHTHTHTLIPGDFSFSASCMPADTLCSVLVQTGGMLFSSNCFASVSGNPYLLAHNSKNQPWPHADPSVSGAYWQQQIIGKFILARQVSLYLFTCLYYSPLQADTQHSASKSPYLH